MQTISVYIQFFLLLFFPLFVLHSQEVEFAVRQTAFSTNVNEEFAPIFYHTDMVYCSNALSNTSIKSEDGKLFNILWAQQKDSLGFKSPVLFSKELTTILNEGPVSFTADFKKIYYSRNINIEGKFKELNDPSNTIGIFTADLVDGIWSNIQALPFNSEKYSAGTPCISPDGKTLFFASDRPDGYGGTDIYYAELTNSGWSEPINLGPNINTEGNESYPFYTQQGQLFFASDGHPGLGDKDIFYTVKKGNNWLPVIHLGENINSPFDDFGLITDDNFESGYFSTDRSASTSIYEFNALLPQFGYCDTVEAFKQCFEFFDERFSDSLHLKYKWSFGNGISKDGYKVKHCFEKPGNYEVLLTIVHHLADSVFETYSSYKFDVPDYRSVGLTNYGYPIANQKVSFKATINEFTDFEVRNRYWNLDSKYKPGELNAASVFASAGLKTVSLGLESAKDEYGRISRKCFVAPVAVYSDINDMVVEYCRNNTILTHDVLRIEPDKARGNYRNFPLNIFVLPDNIPMKQVVQLEKKLEHLQGYSLQFDGTELNEVGMPIIEQIKSIFSSDSTLQVFAGIHSLQKGNSDENLQFTSNFAVVLQKWLQGEPESIKSISVVGKGDATPMYDPKDKSLRNLNQRIDLIIFRDGGKK